MMRPLCFTTIIFLVTPRLHVQCLEVVHLFNVFNFDDGSEAKVTTKNTIEIRIITSQTILEKHLVLPIDVN